LLTRRVSRGWPKLSRASVAFLDEEDLVSDKAVGLSVHRDGRLSRGGFDQAEHLALLLVHPVLLVVDAMRTLRVEIGLVSLGDIVKSDSTVDGVYVHVERHDDSPSKWASDVILLPYGDQHSVGGAEDATIVPVLSLMAAALARGTVTDQLEARSTDDGPMLESIHCGQ
jgi:hypothetical protein